MKDTMSKSELENIRKINQVQKLIAKGFSRWDIAEILSHEWGISTTTVAYVWYPKAKAELLNDEDFREGLREKLLSMYMDVYSESRSEMDRKSALGALNSIVKLNALDQIKDDNSDKQIVISFD